MVSVDTPITVAVISAGALVVVPAVTYYFTKKKEREADWQKYNFELYREFVSALSGIVGTDSTPKGNRRFTEACNTLHLIASGDTIRALHEFQDEIGQSNLNKSRERHDVLLSGLIRAIRTDLHIPGTPPAGQFVARLWCSGTGDKIK